MLFQPFALGIVNDLFDEDLDPDLFQEPAEERPAELTARDCDGLPSGRQAAHAVQPFLAEVAPKLRRLI